MSLAASAKSMSFSVARTDLDAWLAKILMAKSTAGGSRAQWHSRAGCYSPAFPSAAPCPPGARQGSHKFPKQGRNHSAILREVARIISHGIIESANTVRKVKALADAVERG